MTKKYVDGVPLARQEKIWARQGVELSRATLANWVIQCTQSWLKPLYKHMNNSLWLNLLFMQMKLWYRC